MPPGGSYNPAITLESILLSIQLLLASPNADDPLRNDVSDEYKYNRDLFNEQAAKLSGNKDMPAPSTASPTKPNASEADHIDTDPNEVNANVPRTPDPGSSNKISRKRKHDDDTQERS